MILAYRDERFVCFASFDERHIPKGAGFRWDAAAKLWQTQDTEAASRLDQFADDSAWPKLEAYFLSRRAAIESSKAEASTDVLPCPPGLSYLPYQRAGIQYALNRFRKGTPSLGEIGGLPGSGVLIADEPGL